LAEKVDLSKGSEAKLPINLDLGNADVLDEDLSRLHPPTFDDVEQNVQTLIGQRCAKLRRK
jgi:hypothetical protein